MSDSVRPHRRKPTSLPRPWDSPGKNTGVGCHFLLQCMKVKSEREVAQSGPTFSDPMDYSLPGSSIHGIFQARVLEWGAIAFIPNIGKLSNLFLYQSRKFINSVSVFQRTNFSFANILYCFLFQWLLIFLILIVLTLGLPSFFSFSR